MTTTDERPLTMSAPDQMLGSLRMIQAEYREMPGLHLTREQIQRLWNLERGLCDVLVDTLLAARFLRCTPRGAYVLDRH